MANGLKTQPRRLRIEDVSIVPTKDAVQTVINTSRLVALCNDVLAGRIDAVRVWYSANNTEYFDKDRARKFVDENKDGVNFDHITRISKDGKGTFMVGFSPPRNALNEQLPI